MNSSVLDTLEKSDGLEESSASESIKKSNWRAQLNLRFAMRASASASADSMPVDFAAVDFPLKARTVLVERMHSGPLVVQKPLYPEGDRICHAVVVHPPGGIAGGDQLQLNVNIEAGAHALLTTPGAGKWYKANGFEAAQHLQFKLDERATLEWLPQETILFDAARVRMTTRVDLAPDAKFAGWEFLCFGRRAAGEKFAQGHLHQRVQILREDNLLWNESANLEAGSRAMLSPVGLNGHSISAVFLVAAGAVPSKILEACRAILPRENNLFGVTALPEVFAARFIGDHVEHAREYFEQLWQVLRPWYASVDMQRPRIWST